MSTATLEKTAVDTASDLASLVVAYHGRQHHLGEAANCFHDMCRAAAECLNLDTLFYGTDD